MAKKKRKPAKDVAQDRGNGEFWIDHAVIAPSDAEWLGEAGRLTLWNVTLPDDFLAGLRKLWFLDVRGGDATDLSLLTGCKGLRYLQLNQVRNMQDLSLLPSLKKLELLSLYGLPKVEACPSLRPLKKLLRLEVGQMRRLETLGGLLDAAKLEELYLQRKVGITEDDVTRINQHKALKQFEWFSVDVPAKVSDPVMDAIKLPPADAVHAHEWFTERGLVS